MKVSIVKFLPGAIWIMVIFILLVMPGSDIPASEWFEILYFDKWIHIALFAVLVFLWALPFTASSSTINAKLLVIVFMAVVYGVLMEYVQKYAAPTRSFDATDMIADTAGALIGAGVSIIFFKRYKK